MQLHSCHSRQRDDIADVRWRFKAETLVLTAQMDSQRMTYPKPSKGPVMTEFKNSLSHLVCAFLQPILDTSSVVCCGVKASMKCRLSRLFNHNLSNGGDRNFSYFLFLPSFPFPLKTGSGICTSTSTDYYRRWFPQI